MSDTNFGITPDGFKIKTREQITTEVHAALKDKFGGSVDLSPDSNFGRLSGTLIERQVVLWQLARDVYNSGYRATATGVSLDQVAQLINVYRLNALPTKVTALISGDEGTVVPQGSVASTVPDKATFWSVETVKITQESVAKAVVQVVDAVPGTEYTVKLDKVDYSASGIAATMRVEGNENGLISDLVIDGDTSDILTEGRLYWEVAKVQVINQDTYEVTEYVQFRVFRDSEKKWLILKTDLLTDIGIDIPLRKTYFPGFSGSVTLNYWGVEDNDNKNFIVWSVTTTEVRNALAAALPGGTHDSFNISHVGDDMIAIEPKDGITPFSIFTGDNLKVASFHCPQKYESLEHGSILCPAGSLSVIQTPISGWDSIINLNDVLLGRNVETDEEFRERIKNSPRVNAHATKLSIEERLIQEVPGVGDALVVQNINDETAEDDQPPHTIHVIVDIGDNDAIKKEVAEKIWELKPVGIKTWVPPLDEHPESVYKGVIDSQGISRDVYFSMSKRKFIWVKVTIQDYSVHDRPADYVEQIKKNILELGATYILGKTVYAQRLYEPVLNVPGIREVDVAIAYSTPLGSYPNEDTDYLNDKIDIGSTEIAIFDPTQLNRIKVVG